MKPLFSIRTDSASANPNTIYRARSGDLTSIAIWNTSKDDVSITETVEQSMVQFYFAVRGKVTFTFAQGHYQRTLAAQRCFLVYDPSAEMPILGTLHPDTQLLGLFISNAALHRLVLHTDVMPFLHGEGSKRSFYAERPMNGPLLMAAEHVFYDITGGRMTELMLLSRAYECLHRYVDQRNTDDDVSDACPFLRDEANVERLRKAKEIVLSQSDDPPPLRELARLVGMNEYQLKVGFKRIYGAPVYKYVHEYRMGQAREMLSHPATTVNEVAYAIGYSNPSHFIAAFKKRHGMTPKQFMTEQPAQEDHGDA